MEVSETIQAELVAMDKKIDSRGHVGMVPLTSLIRHAIIATKLDIYLGSVLKNQKEADVEVAKADTKAEEEEMVDQEENEDLLSASDAERKVTLLAIVLKKIPDLKVIDVAEIVAEVVEIVKEVVAEEDNTLTAIVLNQGITSIATVVNLPSLGVKIKVIIGDENTTTQDAKMVKKGTMAAVEIEIMRKEVDHPASIIEREHEIGSLKVIDKMEVDIENVESIKVDPREAQTFSLGLEHATNAVKKDTFQGNVPRTTVVMEAEALLRDLTAVAEMIEGIEETIMEEEEEIEKTEMGPGKEEPLVPMQILVEPKTKPGKRDLMLAGMEVREGLLPRADNLTGEKRITAAMFDSCLDVC